ncbi:hypothetical protein [Rickettsiales endosymbiont of Stachyamoeba lipophora]|uniref:hypothetical protein n=1 Tax=Rickettsiales endosymbiont of Stachyamoeba lipophora TaxID=2486578 RepID=UPI000F651F7A|nr:hypothetical protein [Rickettsiales endosymbiont of Stachyamoeba lipophora]AZL15424.1 hypothetical protein EF513_02505 [Rickettsiales endosymbiont of Stachyamoeba lipophora]
MDNKYTEKEFQELLFSLDGTSDKQLIKNDHRALLSLREAAKPQALLSFIVNYASGNNIPFSDLEVSKLDNRQELELVDKLLTKIDNQEYINNFQNSKYYRSLRTSTLQEIPLTKPNNRHSTPLQSSTKTIINQDQRHSVPADYTAKLKDSKSLNPASHIKDNFKKSFKQMSEQLNDVSLSINRKIDELEDKSKLIYRLNSINISFEKLNKFISALHDFGRTITVNIKKLNSIQLLSIGNFLQTAISTIKAKFDTVLSKSQSNDLDVISRQASTLQDKSAKHIIVNKTEPALERASKPLSNKETAIEPSKNARNEETAVNRLSIDTKRLSQIGIKLEGLETVSLIHQNHKTANSKQQERQKLPSNIKRHSANLKNLREAKEAADYTPNITSITRNPQTQNKGKGI